MTDQLIIDFPDMPHELEKHFLVHKEEIKASLWDGETRKSVPLKWDGSRICCPVTIWYDLPDNVQVTIKLDTFRTEEE